MKTIYNKMLNIKNTLFTFIVLLISIQAQAVHLSSTGMGQVLIFPYYTVNNGLDTLINIVNTTNQAKALRVRFREAANSKEVFTFNLYLGPHDVWTAGLVEGDHFGVGTRIITRDISCTIPSILNLSAPGMFPGQLFTKDKFTGDSSDAYGTETERVREGFIEIIEMGVMVGNSAAATIIDDNQPQPNCSLLQNAWDSNSSNPYWRTNSSTDMQAPSGGIMGNIILINVAEGIAVTEEPTVLGNFSNSILHFPIEDISPNLADGSTLAQVEYQGSVIDINWDKGFEAVSSVLIKNSISNEFALSNSIDAKTDWIITLPTKQYHLDNDGQGTTDHLAPFTQASSSIVNCEPYAVDGIYDREEQLDFVPPDPGIVGSPLPPSLSPTPVMCYASNYMSFFNVNDDIGDGFILAGNYSVTISYFGLNSSVFRTNFQEGWTTLGFNGNSSLPPSASNQAMTINDTIIEGLPVIGFSVQSYANSFLTGDILANYAGLFKHKSNKSIVKSDNHTSKSGMMVSEQGIGQVLLSPYYTVKNGMNTLISIVNTTDEVKAVKVRFNEGKNGRNALSFNLYLGPYDVWTAGLVPTYSTTVQVIIDGLDTVKIISNDTSCTVPEINGSEFTRDWFHGEYYDQQGANIYRTREGTIEIIEMGTLVSVDAMSVTHTPNGFPSNCGAINNNWTPVTGQWSLDPTVNMIAPDGTGGLYASVSLIDVADGTDLTLDATAIVGFSNEVQHTGSGSLSPNLSTGNQTDTVIETEAGFIETTWSSPIDAVSALFMQSQVINDFEITPSIGAQTEWVNAFPTKPFYVDSLYTGIFLAQQPFNIGLEQDSGACEVHRFKAFDREQRLNIKTNDPDLTPPVFNAFPKDCWSIVVSDVNSGTDENSIFGSELKLNDLYADPDYTSVNDIPFTSGWMQIDFVDEVIIPGKLVGRGRNGDVHEIFGKPVLGFVAQKYINNNLAGGVLANYATINKNKGRRKFLINGVNSK